MKKIMLPAFVFATVIFGAFILNTAYKNAPIVGEKELPEQVKSIIDQSCFQCHNADSQNEKAREALDFKAIDELGKVKKITTLKEIAEVIEKGEMPPKKFLEKFPEKKLTEEQTKIMADWSKKEIDTLLGK
ncbi:MAG: heme-binding domain-containing protein [Mariniphaga sp.]|nr:heme-binding domain-containing protein [Mariniphaga sp.]